MNEQKGDAIQEIDGLATPCWIYKKCPMDRREKCPAFPLYGYECMQKMQTMCKGKLQSSIQKKLFNCSQCDFVHQGNHSIAKHKRMKFDKKGIQIS